MAAAVTWRCSNPGSKQVQARALRGCKATVHTPRPSLQAKRHLRDAIRVIAALGIVQQQDAAVGVQQAQRAGEAGSAGAAVDAHEVKAHQLVRPKEGGVHVLEEHLHWVFWLGWWEDGWVGGWVETPGARLPACHMCVMRPPQVNGAQATLAPTPASGGNAAAQRSSGTPCDAPCSPVPKKRSCRPCR